MKTKHLLSVAILAASVFATMGCSSDNEQTENSNNNGNNNGNTPKTWTLTVSADRANGTRALADDGSKLNATWETTDVITVLKAGAKVGTLNPKTAGVSSVLAGTLTGDISVNDELTLWWPNNEVSYEGQDGTLTKVASTYDYSKATITVSAVNVATNTLSATGVAMFESQQAIVKFKFTDGTNSLAVKELKITADKLANSPLTITNGNAEKTDPMYVALHSTGNDKYKFEVTATDGIKYTANFNATLVDGKYYPNVPLTLTPQPGKFTINADGDQVFIAPGNLRWDADGGDGKWSLFEHQWGYYGGNEVHADGGLNVDENHWDLFGWSTVAANNNYGMTTSQDNEVYAGTFKDWGEIANAAKFYGYDNWFTLSSAEWTYLLSTRTTVGTVFGSSNVRYAYGEINSDDEENATVGLIIFPDGVDIATSEFSGTYFYESYNKWLITECTTAEWATLERKGCVFLPAAGYRAEPVGEHSHNWWINEEDPSGFYWSSTKSDEITSNTGKSKAYYLFFSTRFMAPNDIDRIPGRYVGRSVRLVRPVPAE